MTRGGCRLGIWVCAVVLRLATVCGAAERIVVWDLEALGQTPSIHATAECPAEGMRAFFYEGAEYKGRPTRVFAYYAAPAGEPPAGGWPAVVCAHGGGGTAYPEWVKQWNAHGYAAISMDLEGHLPDQRGHDGAGPARKDWFGDRDLPDREKWFYHAVADVIRAHSLLRSFPEINRDKIGLTGISWGGTISSAVAGVDARFAFAIPVYGCGYIHESDNEGLRQWFTIMTEDQLRDYRTKWDPSAHLPYAKMPMLWPNGTNDGTFPMDIYQRSALLTAGPRTLCIRFRWLHGHEPGWRRKEIYAFADSVVRGGPPLLTAARPEFDAATRRVRCATTGPVAKAALCYTIGQGAWTSRYWENAACEIGQNEVTSQLPPEASVFYFNVKDDRDCLVSSEFVEVSRAIVPQGK